MDYAERVQDIAFGVFVSGVLVLKTRRLGQPVTLSKDLIRCLARLPDDENFT